MFSNRQAKVGRIMAVSKLTRTILNNSVNGTSRTAKRRISSNHPVNGIRRTLQRRNSSNHCVNGNPIPHWYGALRDSFPNEAEVIYNVAQFFEMQFRKNGAKAKCVLRYLGIERVSA